MSSSTPCHLRHHRHTQADTGFRGVAPGRQASTKVSPRHSGPVPTVLSRPQAPSAPTPERPSSGQSVSTLVGTVDIDDDLATAGSHDDLLGVGSRRVPLAVDGVRRHEDGVPGPGVYAVPATGAATGSPG